LGILCDCLVIRTYHILTIIRHCLDNGHSNKCIVISLCCFNLKFPNDMWDGISSHMSFYLPPLMRRPLLSLAHFQLSCLFSYCWVLQILCLLWIEVLYKICLLKIFSSNLWLSFHFLKSVFCRAKKFNFNKVILTMPKGHYQYQDHVGFLLCFYKFHTCTLYM
jgi:hypothetical protein